MFIAFLSWIKYKTPAALLGIFTSPARTGRVNELLRGLGAGCTVFKIEPLYCADVDLPMAMLQKI
ncbi:hypothetical protein DP115_21935 [Brasilonema octagenarum UFV-OR1]|uniref:Uncharacterized protein n=1 Tax=Brasilonema octagenarum UFV-OR1 TaxID=417115 RepID=A0ABX1M9K0_9CYAN|nr:hypothetical protein [Brasilonema octagenarum UFV-OR1]